MEADRLSVPQTWSGNTKRTIAEARAGPWHYKHVTVSDDRS